MLSKIKEIYTYRQMLESLVLTDLRTRYKGSYLGFFWTLLNPLLMLLVYSIVFKYIVRIQMDHYTTFLFVGLMTWTLLAQSLNSGSGSIIRNAGLVKKIYFPKEILPLSVVLGGIINYLFSLIILFPMIFLSGLKLGLPLLIFPIVLLGYSLFVLALTMLVSAFNVYMRDLEHIVGIIIMAWFYLTPIVFTSEMIPKDLQFVFQLNPMKIIIESFHDIFFYNKFPDLSALGIFYIFSIALLIISFAVFRKLSRNFAEEI
ncbi:ABC transporter permease [Paenibacillus humicus]|uniref:ABC transporter permease n=1 Tax=Paenibacillus humicus TaxID=412861 RepID=UPI000FD93EA7|nr:ABC transporter permease [Paenibacillus humicus]